MAPGAGRHDEGSSVTAVQLSPRRRRAVKALGHDDHPNVGSLIGYSYRKFGDYKFSQVWYERALKADPNHLLTWQYCGLWQIEQGNRDQAQENAERPGITAGPFF
jgi:tetratricopeptide (TPR) repeat protein